MRIAPLDHFPDGRAVLLAQGGDQRLLHGDVGAAVGKYLIHHLGRISQPHDVHAEALDAGRYGRGRLVLQALGDHGLPGSGPVDAGQIDVGLVVAGQDPPPGRGEGPIGECRRDRCD